jgi:hypothetical protein
LLQGLDKLLNSQYGNIFKEKMQIYTKLLSVFPFVIFVSLVAYPLPTYSQARVLSESIEYLMRLSTKSMPKVEPAYQVLAKGVAVVNTANGAYRIYVDCQRGAASNSINYLPQDQQISLIRAMCANFR